MLWPRARAGRTDVEITHAPDCGSGQRIRRKHVYRIGRIGRCGEIDPNRSVAAVVVRAGRGERVPPFPRSYAPVYGDLIARFLRGEFGGVETVNPYLVALIYAGDRADAASQLRKWLDEGKAVILDRYVWSNVGYQCAKLPAGAERDRLARWILDLEFGYNHLPRPDVSLFLDVPFAFTERKLAETREGDDRSYLHGARDIHEDSLSLQQRVREVYLAATQTDPTLRSWIAARRNRR